MSEEEMRRRTDQLKEKLFTRHGQFFQILKRKDGFIRLRCGVCRGPSFEIAPGPESVEVRATKAHFCEHTN